MSLETVVLLAAILLLFAVYLFAVWKIGLRGLTREQFILPAKILAPIFGFLVFIYLLLNLQNIQAHYWVLISLYAGLVGVTVLYTLSANWQAVASMQMVKEMKEQRYDSVRPVIDIQRVVSSETQAIEAYAAIHDDTSHGLSCILCNIGLGPATDVYSFIQDSEQVRRRLHFDTLPIGGKTVLPMSLSLEQEDDRIALVVYYKDVYGRAFESRREVIADKEKHGWEIHPLQVRLIKEDELP